MGSDIHVSRGTRLASTRMSDVVWFTLEGIHLCIRIQPHFMRRECQHTVLESTCTPAWFYDTEQNVVHTKQNVTQCWGCPAGSTCANPASGAAEGGSWVREGGRRTRGNPRSSHWSNLHYRQVDELKVKILCLLHQSRSAGPPTKC